MRPRNALRCRGDHVVQLIQPGLLVLQVVLEPEPQIAGARTSIRRVRPNLVAGDLLFDEPVVRLVLVERPDHVIAISPGFRTVAIVLEAAGVGIADHIEPVPAPALAVVRRSKKILDHLGERLRRRIVYKRVDLRRL